MQNFLSHASFWTPESLVPSAWTEHAPFAFWLVNVHRPSLLVELGSHFGYSYFAFNQALKQLEIKCRCFAVDTWQGDEHAGYYGDEVYEGVGAYNGAHYPDSSELLRMTFDEAAEKFEDGTIDLLHIDGRHFYEDVKHDFETWLPKLSDRAVVLLHDTNVTANDFGVYRLWNELRAEHPSFEFLMGHGLGVLGVGKQLPDLLKQFFEASNREDETAFIRTAYLRLGSAIVDRVTVQRLAADKAAVLATHKELDGMYHQVAGECTRLNTLVQALSSEHSALQNRYGILEGSYNALLSKHTELEQQCAGTLERNRALETTADQLRSQYAKSLQDTQSRTEQTTTLTRQLAEQSALGSLLARRVEQLETQNDIIQKSKNEQDRAFNAVLTSTSWRLTAPLRRGDSKPALPAIPSGIRARRVQKKYRAILTALFDEQFYLEQNPDVKQSGANPLKHYLRRGAFEGRDPHPLFDTDWYLAQNPDVAGTRQNPLLHYIEFGSAEGRDPHPLFDSAFYRRKKPDLLPSGTNVLQHYVAAQGRNVGDPHPLFDTAFYLAQSPELAQSSINPLSHYLTLGWQQRLNPHPLFDVAFYTAATEIESEPLQHYLEQGALTGIDPHPLFDSRWYIGQSPDVAAANLNPLLHYVNFGSMESRSPHPLFDAAWYWEQNPDVAATGISPLIHYVQTGFRENRNPHPLFDAIFYVAGTPQAAGLNSLVHYVAANGMGVGNPHPLFDTAWYLEQNPNIAATGTSPLVHYIKTGFREGRNPHPLFDSAFYAAGTPQAAGLNPLLHYVAANGAGGGNPHPLFDTVWYLEQNPDIASAGLNPLAHYVQTGFRDGRNPHPLFDSTFYAAGTPQAAGLNPLAHYVTANGVEAGNPHPLFDTSFYLAQVPLFPDRQNPLIHYLQHGWQQGLNPHWLFEGLFYRETNPDLSQLEPVSHYLRYGARENRNPHPLFDTGWYREQNPDIERAGLNPLLHYIQIGFREGRTPHALFDTFSYGQRNAIPAHVNPLAHYLEAKGRGVGDPHPLFDTGFYLAQNLALSDETNPLLHYLQHGWQQGLNPHVFFDISFYRETNPDVSQFEPLRHYLRYGAREDRDPHPLFDTSWYREQNPDVARTGINPLVHFVLWGHQLPLSPSPFFDSAFYVSTYPDVKAAGLNPLTHYILHGVAEGRRPNAGFNPNVYLAVHPDVATKQINPLIHYVRWGRFEDPEKPVEPTVQKRRIVFVSGEPGTPGHRYRVANLAGALPSQFFDVHVLNISEVQIHMREFVLADVVWIWRAGWSTSITDIITVAKNGGAKLVFDVDDLMFRPELAKVDIIDGIRSQGFAEEQVEKFYADIRTVVAHVDYCTAPTATLARELRAIGKPVTVIPNGFDSDLLRAFRSAALTESQKEQDGLIRIGYASGTLTHQRDFAVAVPALASVLEGCPDARLVLFRHTIRLDEFPELAKHADQIEWRDTVPLDQLPYEYARFSINIAPLQVGNRYCEAKSELKYFEAALAGVPTVASPTQPFADAISDGETGFLASSEEEWHDKLLLLVRDPERRAAMASKARNSAVWLYGPERRSLLLSKLVNQLLSPQNLQSQLFVLETRPEKPEDLPVPTIPAYQTVFQSRRRAASRISVVIPVFNYAHLLPEALESVRTQTVKDIDVVVVDDCSTDHSLTVAAQWLRQHAGEFNCVTLLKNQQNSNLGRSRNAGVHVCDTEFYLPLDPDNQLLPDCIERSLELLEQTGAAFAYPTIEMFGDQTGKLGECEFNPALFPCGNYIDAMAIVRKACWIAVGGYGALEPPGWEDFDFWCKLIEKGFFGVRVPKVIARYRVHGNSMLRTITELPENKPLVIADLNKRHPWLDLRLPSKNAGSSSDTAPPNDAPSDPAEPSSAMDLNTLIGLLECPETGEDLILFDDQTLTSRESGRTWPIVNGRPVFTADGRDVLIHPETHVSNKLCDEAVHIIETTPGLVLNLSAGASTVRYNNLVELEYSIFKHTNVVGDVHRLPFKEQMFDAVVCMNAFEHYCEPDRAMAEIRRILKPGGRLFLHTAFLQPLHEEPHHYYNCTEFGLRQWLRDFENADVRVSSNFNPAYTLSWLASEMESAFREGVSEQAARLFGEARLRELMVFWRDPGTRTSPLWSLFYMLPEAMQKRFAAGWEAEATKAAKPDPSQPKLLAANSSNGVG